MTALITLPRQSAQALRIALSNLGTHRPKENQPLIHAWAKLNSPQGD